MALAAIEGMCGDTPEMQARPEPLQIKRIMGRSVDRRQRRGGVTAPASITLQYSGNTSLLLLADMAARCPEPVI